MSIEIRCRRVRAFRTMARAAAWAVLLLAMSNRTASAQESASIIGQVTDESGAILPGVTVTASSPVLQVGEITVVTDERGEYRIAPLPIGTYDVLYTLAGFQSMKRERIRLTVGFVAKLDLQLKIGALEETLTVTGQSPIVDVTTTGTRTELTQEMLEGTPTGRNGLQSLLALTPGVRTNLDVGGSTFVDGVVFRAYGQSNDSWSTLDGILTTSSKTTQSGNYFDYSSYEEARVQAVANDVEVPARGISLASVIKSGGNQYHGTGFLAQTGPNFESDNVDDALKASGLASQGDELLTRWDRSFELSGRIVPNRLWFFASTRGRRSDNTVLDIKQEDGSPATRNQGQTFATYKINYQLSQSNRINGFHHWTRKTETRGVSQFVPWESRTEQDGRDHTLGVEWQSTIGNSLVMSVQTGYFNWDTNYLQVADFGRPATIDVVTQYVTGPATEGGSIPFESRHHTKGGLAWYRPDAYGSHEIKIGADYITNPIKRGWVSRGSNLNYRLQYSSSSAFQLETWNYPIVPESNSHYFNTYIRDNWIIGRRLTLNLGARFQRDRGFIPAQCRGDADPKEFQPAQCFDRVEMDVWNSVAPRLYAAYDVGGDSRTVIKGGWGRFYALRETEDVLPFNLNIAATSTWRWHDNNGDKLYQPGEVNLDPNGGDFLSRSGRITDAPFTNAVLNPDEKQPYQDQLNASIEHQIVSDFAVRGSVFYSHSFNVRRVPNTLRPYETYNIPITNLDPGPDGVLNTADDTGQAFTYYDYPATLAGLQFQKQTWDSPPGQDQTFSSFEFSAVKRLTNRWQFMGSYSATRINAPFRLESEFNPNAEINVDDQTWEWGGKLSGSYLFPWDVTMAANFEHRSGTPQARQVLFRGGRQVTTLVVNVEPYGSIRLPNTNLTDVRAEKTLRFTATQRVALRVTLYNVFNSNTVTSRTLRSGPDFLRPSAIVNPRIAEFSASYSF